ncbi:hypothetical protein [Paenibacillus sp. YYML68]|uniref:hypothetical protein n=1 Tax=Paenibacillus sp. YYML68 TaxID=2909250 RepID=UPI0024935E12|nr:hypothetical protein [Paenibacillus sp. YYML68]
MLNINIQWYGSFSLDELISLNDVSKDYGVYQIYGSHPVYGSNVLLYIGKAVRQTFATRISQENWHFNKDSENVRIYVGRLSGIKNVSVDVWDSLIDKAEKLLIYAHAPACNSSNIGTVPYDDLLNLHVINWGNHRDLMPEVSGLRWIKQNSCNVEYSI